MTRFRNRAVLRGSAIADAVVCVAEGPAVHSRSLCVHPFPRDDLRKAVVAVEPGCPVSEFRPGATPHTVIPVAHAMDVPRRTKGDLRDVAPCVVCSRNRSHIASALLPAFTGNVVPVRAVFDNHPALSACNGGDAA